MLEAAQGTREHITVFGTDYPTPDGTCIRDYIHIYDLARAHIYALEKLRDGGDSIACNLGTGIGHSVKEVIETAEQVTGKKIPIVYGERREGDPPELVAKADLAEDLLGWKAEYLDLNNVIETAWKWMNGPNVGRFKN